MFVGDLMFGKQNPSKYHIIESQNGLTTFKFVNFETIFLNNR